jgi:hypothetical protein
MSDRSPRRHRGGARQLGKRQDVSAVPMATARCTPRRTQYIGEPRPSGPADGQASRPSIRAPGARDAILEEHASLASNRTSQRPNCSECVAHRGDFSTHASRGRRARLMDGRAGPAHERPGPRRHLGGARQLGKRQDVAASQILPQCCQRAAGASHAEENAVRLTAWLMVRRAGPAHERQEPATSSWRSTPAWQATGRCSWHNGCEQVARRGERSISASRGRPAQVMVRRAGPAHEQRGPETPSWRSAPAWQATGRRGSQKTPLARRAPRSA